MADKSAIEWTDATWNPVRGCAIVSKGCTNCYAMRQARRQSRKGLAYEGLTKLTKGGPVWTGKVRTVPELLDWPLHRRKPSHIFVNSMSDLFHEDVPDIFIAQVFATMLEARWHTFQILTKRPARMLATIKRFIDENEEYGGELPENVPPRNAWLGVSVEDQATADERIPLLLQTPAAVRWISAEPLLGPVNLAQIRDDDALLFPLAGEVTGEGRNEPVPLRGGGIHWVVVGGESGPGARPMHPDWARSLRDQCAAACVPFFFKQWGNWVECECEVHADERGREVIPVTKIDGHRCEDEEMIERMGERGFRCGTWHGTEFVNVGKKIAGRLLDGRMHDEYPA